MVRKERGAEREEAAERKIEGIDRLSWRRYRDLDSG